MKEFLQDLIQPQTYGTSFDIDNDIEIFHEKTKWFRGTFHGQLNNITRYLVNPVYVTRGASGYNEFSNLPLIELPEPNLLKADLAQMLAARRSTPNLSGMLEMSELSTLLYHAVGVNRELSSTIASNAKISFRPYPSPGGLYPAEIYVYLNNVEGIEPCIAHYDARKHSLRVIKTVSDRAFEKVEIQSGGNRALAPVAIVMTMVPQRVTVKYGGRGYRMGLLEVGHASQNICLVAQGLGMGTLVYGSYYDDELSKELEIDAVTETVATVILVGKIVP